eukprot:scpid43642/ scgid24473/ 
MLCLISETFSPRNPTDSTGRGHAPLLPVQCWALVDYEEWTKNVISQQTMDGRYFPRSPSIDSLTFVCSHGVAAIAATAATARSPAEAIFHLYFSFLVRSHVLIHGLGGGWWAGFDGCMLVL